MPSGSPSPAPWRFTSEIPDYSGGSLVNLVAEIEARLTGTAEVETLHPELAAALPPGAGYVMVLFDGLGDLQLGHPGAAALTSDRMAALDAPFPTTTTVSLATVATGTAPRRHGLIAYQLWLPALATVVNTIKWTTLWGDPVDVDTSAFLPAPNLWERLAARGVEAVTVQPAGFAGTPLTDALYRGARFVGVADVAAWVDAVCDAAGPERLVFAYLPHIDFAAHVSGQESEEYAAALEVVSQAWIALRRRLPPGVALIGTADHGHVDIPEVRRHRIPKPAHEGRVFYGDTRALFVRGRVAGLPDDLPARWIPREEAEAWWGPGPAHPEFELRAPHGILLAADGHALLHRFSDERLIGAHGALTQEERRIPLLVGAP